MITHLVQKNYKKGMEDLTHTSVTDSVAQVHLHEMKNLMNNVNEVVMPCVLIALVIIIFGNTTLYRLSHAVKYYLVLLFVFYWILMFYIF